MKYVLAIAAVLALTGAADAASVECGWFKYLHIGCVDNDNICKNTCPQVIAALHRKFGKLDGDILIFGDDGPR